MLRPLIVCSSFLAAATLVTDVAIAAETSPISFEIPGGDLVAALNMVAQQSGADLALAVSQFPPAIKKDILAFYADPNAPITTKKSPQAWAQVQADLVKFQDLSTSNEPEPFPTYGQDNDTAPQ